MKWDCGTKSLVMWAGALVSKFMYLYSGLTNISQDEFTFGFNDLTLLYSVIGILAALCGVMISFKLHNDKNFYSLKIIQKIGNRKSRREEAKHDLIYTKVFILGLGWIEVSVGLGYIGFLDTGSISYFLSMILISILGWSFSFPQYTKFMKTIDDKVSP